MRKLDFFTLILSVQSLTEKTAVSSCIKDVVDDDATTFGDLKYITIQLASCKALIFGDESVVAESDCVETPRSTRLDVQPITTDIVCSITDIDQCPKPPKGCSVKSSLRAAAGSCEYECKDQKPICPDDDDLNYPYGLTKSTMETWCFNKSYSKCIDVDETPRENDQIRKSCTYKLCGFKDDEKYTLTFDTLKFVNTYNTGNLTSAPDVFGCKNNFAPSGCSCTFDDSSPETTMVCADSSYTDTCKDTDCEIIDLENNKVCYDGVPIMEYDSINCGVRNSAKEEENIFYCKRDKKSVFTMRESLA